MTRFPTIDAYRLLDFDAAASDYLETQLDMMWPYHLLEFIRILQRPPPDNHWDTHYRAQHHQLVPWPASGGARSAAATRPVSQPPAAGGNSAPATGTDAREAAATRPASQPPAAGGNSATAAGSDASEAAPTRPVSQPPAAGGNSATAAGSNAREAAATRPVSQPPAAGGNSATAAGSDAREAAPTRPVSQPRAAGGNSAVATPPRARPSIGSGGTHTLWSIDSLSDLRRHILRHGLADNEPDRTIYQITHSYFYCPFLFALYNMFHPDLHLVELIINNGCQANFLNIATGVLEPILPDPSRWATMFPILSANRLPAQPIIDHGHHIVDHDQDRHIHHLTLRTQEMILIDVILESFIINGPNRV